MPSGWKAAAELYIGAFRQVDTVEAVKLLEQRGGDLDHRGKRQLHDVD